MDKKDFLFSIIVPVYNTSKYVEKCLKSIEKAIDTDCEVIIVNDGSTDNSEEIIKNYIAKLPKKYKDNFVYTKKKNKGLADTKNVGIELSRGEFISVIDSDDYISEDFYTVARKYVKDYDVIIYDLYVIFEKDKKQNYTSRAYRDYIEDDLISFMNGAMSGSSCNKIIKKTLYKGHTFPVGKEYEDVAVTPFIISEAKNIKYVPYPMYYYLQREKSIVASNTYASAFYKICNNISEVLKGKDLDKYKYVINEFLVVRTLENLDSDMNENKDKFIQNLEKFKKKNNSIIKYSLDNNLMYELEGPYTERQKALVKNILEFIKNEEYSKVINVLTKRKLINKIRRIIKR